MKIAVAQVVSTTDPSENLELVRQWTHKGAEAGASLVVFPEAMMASFATASAKVAEPLEGPWAAAVREIAQECGVTVALGMFEASDEDRPYNTILVTGDVESHYRKMHMYDAWGFTESDYIIPGDAPVSFELGGLKFGIATCYDVRFPALFQEYGRDGVDVVLLPVSWANGPGKAEQFTTLATARAMDATCYVVAAAQGDPASVGSEVKKGAPTGVGHSIVVDPVGKVLAKGGDAPELLVVDVEADAVAKAREQVPVLKNARFTTQLDARK